MKISLVAAIADNLAIGKGGDLPWRLPDDLAFFKKYTLGKPLLMGRKTFDSIGRKPLPGRPHLIVSRQAGETQAQVNWYTSVQAAIVAAEPYLELCVVGGAEIYLQTLPFATDLVLTRVHATPEADTFFPQWNTEEWLMVESSFHPADEKHAYSFNFEHYQRITL